MIKFVLKFDGETFKILTSTAIHGAEKLAWIIRIPLESLQHIFKMYTWSVSGNWASI
jgi:hypothetical protein